MPYPHFSPPHDPFRIFYGLTGITFFAFATGFSVCLFDMSKVSECVDYAEKMTTMLGDVGAHILSWFSAVVEEILRRHPPLH